MATKKVTIWSFMTNPSPVVSLCSRLAFIPLVPDSRPYEGKAGDSLDILSPPSYRIVSAESRFG
jgi:hypothetical protein